MLCRLAKLICRVGEPSQPSASRIAAELEREVGAALLTRTTRGVTLTEAGADYLARIEPLLTALEEAESATRSSNFAKTSMPPAAHTAAELLDTTPSVDPR